MAVLEARLNVNKLEGSENFHTCYIDVRVLLRRDKLWVFASSSRDALKGIPAYDEYNDKVIDAADLITLTLSDHVKAQMPSEVFDNGRLMLETLREYHLSQRVIDGSHLTNHDADEAVSEDNQMQVEKSDEIAPDSLLRLPPELRNMVYELVLSLPLGRKHYLKQFHHKSSKEPGLLRTCKQIRQEASPVYYCNNRVAADIDLNQTSKELSLCMKQVKAIIQRCGAKPFKSFEIGLHGTIWDHLKDFLPLLEVMRETGFEPSAEEYEWGKGSPWWLGGPQYTTKTSIFHMPAISMGNAQFVLEKALCLARRAHAEGWDAVRLAKRFKAFVSDQSRPSRRGKRLKIMVEGKQL